MRNEHLEASDDEIIGRVLDGDVNAFERLVDRYRNHVFGVVMKHVPIADVEEVAHDVFVRAYQALPTFRHRSEFQRWLSVIAVRTSSDYWREKYRSRELPMSSLGEDEQRWLDSLASNQSSSRDESEEASREAREVLAWAMRELSVEDRMVLELVHIEERPVREAADLLGWSVANVKVRAFRARRKLRSILGRLFERRKG